MTLRVSRSSDSPPQSRTAVGDRSTRAHAVLPPNFLSEQAISVDTVRLQARRRGEQAVRCEVSSSKY